MNAFYSALLLSASMMTVSIAPVAHAQTAPAAAAPYKKNWTPPAYKIKSQVMVDAMMAAHPELLGLTIHGIPPGGTEFTMFAASYHDRIGKVSGVDDALATTMGRVMIETHFKPGENKAVVLVPLKDKSGHEIATAVFGFHDNVGNIKGAPYYLGVALNWAAAMSEQFSSHDDLFARAN